MLIEMNCVGSFWAHKMNCAITNLLTIGSSGSPSEWEGTQLRVLINRKSCTVILFRRRDQRTLFPHEGVGPVVHLMLQNVSHFTAVRPAVDFGLVRVPDMDP